MKRTRLVMLSVAPAALALLGVVNAGSASVGSCSSLAAINAPEPAAKTVESEAKVIARWWVSNIPDQSSRRSENMVVPLTPGQTATLRIQLPEHMRNVVSVTLMHDKRRAWDKARTQPLSDGATVSGDAHDWRGFNKRIYIGRVTYRGGSEARLWEETAGFWVTLEVK